MQVPDYAKRAWNACPRNGGERSFRLGTVWVQIEYAWLPMSGADARRRRDLAFVSLSAVLSPPGARQGACPVVLIILVTRV
jgi:hypothetical protein